MNLEQKHLLIAALIVCAAFVIQPFSLLFHQNYISPKIYEKIVGQMPNSQEGGSISEAKGQTLELPNSKIYGNKEAEIFVVEYSDFECPFCERFHSTMKEVANESNGKISWIYRHFPLSAHPGALPTAIKSECIAKLGGEQKFWDFSNKVFEGGRRTDSSTLNKYIAEIGMNAQAVSACEKDKAIADLVNEQFMEGQKLGVNGTPGSFIVKKEGGKYIILDSIEGALPKEAILSTINKLK